MNIRYDPEDDILSIEFSPDKIIRDESHGWNLNIGYSENGIAEITILEAREKGFLPLQKNLEELLALTKAA